MRESSSSLLGFQFCSKILKKLGFWNPFLLGIFSKIFFKTSSGTSSKLKPSSDGSSDNFDWSDFSPGHFPWQMHSSSDIFQNKIDGFLSFLTSSWRTSADDDSCWSELRRLTANNVLSLAVLEICHIWIYSWLLINSRTYPIFEPVYLCMTHWKLRLWLISLTSSKWWVILARWVILIKLLIVNFFKRLWLFREKCVFYLYFC